MLRDSSDVTRLVACATDQARHDWMLAVTGGDVTSMSEITAAQDLVLSCDQPDLTAMGKLAIHRDRTAERNASIPTGLPALWAAIGHPERGEALALSIVSDRPGGGIRERAIPRVAIVDSTSESHRRDTALAELVPAVGARGDFERAESLADAIRDPKLRGQALAGLALVMKAADDAERAAEVWRRAEGIAAAVDSPDQADSPSLRILQALVDVAAQAGDVDQAEATAETITDLPEKAIALTTVAQAAAATGDIERAVALTDKAEEVSRAITVRDYIGLRNRTFVQFRMADALVSVVEAAAESGDFRSAVRVADRSAGLYFSLANDVVTPGARSNQLLALTNALVTAAQAAVADRGTERAEEIAVEAREKFIRSKALQALSGAMAASGDIDQAEVLANRIENTEFKAEQFAALAHEMTAARKPHRSKVLTKRAENIAESIEAPYWRTLAQAQAAAAAGDIGLSAELAGALKENEGQIRALLKLAFAAADRNDMTAAKLLADTIRDPYQRARALALLARKAAVACDAVQAAQLIASAEVRARTIESSADHDDVLSDLASVSAHIGDTGQTDALIEAISDANRREYAQAGAAIASGATGNLERTDALISAIKSAGKRAEVLAEHAEIAAEFGDVERVIRLAEKAEKAAREVIEPHRQAQALTVLALAAARAGDPDRAIELAGDIIIAGGRVNALLKLAGTMIAMGDADRVTLVIELARTAADASDNRQEREYELAKVTDFLVKIDASDTLLRGQGIGNAANINNDPAGQVKIPIGDTRISATKQAYSLMARELAEHDWTGLVETLARLDTAALNALTDEYVKTAPNPEI